MPDRRTRLLQMLAYFDQQVAELRTIHEQTQDNWTRQKSATMLAECQDAIERAERLLARQG